MKGDDAKRSSGAQELPPLECELMTSDDVAGFLYRCLYRTGSSHISCCLL